VRQDDVLVLVAQPGDPDQPADGRSFHRVLVEVERLLLVNAQVALLTPLLQPAAHREIGPLEPP
jgi:hypothetical protein